MGGGQRFSAGVRKSVLAVAEFPGQTKSVVGLINNYFKPQGVPNTYSGYLEFPSGSNGISGFLLVSYFSSNGTNVVSLINLSSRSSQVVILPSSNHKTIEYSDYLSGSEPKRQSSLSSRHRIWHPYISRDGSITYTIPWNDLISVDLKTGRERWRVRGAFHHSIEPDASDNLWVCGAIEPESQPHQNSKTHQANKGFEDQALVKISPSGKILKTISVADIIVESGLEYLLYGSSNPNVNLDPIHLNQITPILRDSGVFRKGHILASLRNLSTIILFDPDSKSIVWHGSGNWMNQHCVKPIDSSTFSVLDNHSFASGEFWLNPSWRTRIVGHNIETRKTFEISVNGESPKDFHIPVEGRALPINSETWIVEDCNQGTIMIFKNQRLVFKWTNLYPDGTVGVTSWCRYLDPDTVPEFLQKKQ